MGRRADLRHSLTRLETRLNDSFASTSLGRHFKLGPRNSTFTRELRAGLATFLTMAYILSVNASIIADSGGSCPPPASDTCLARTRADLVTATAAACVVACIGMGALANLPFALAPGMGVNTYFAYNLVGFRGSGRVPYRTALAVVLVEGCVFFTLSALGIRARLARLIPRGIRLASAAGIGLFLAFAGLQAHVGVGLVGPDPATLVTLSACARTDPETGACEGGRLRSPTFWLGALGFTITAYCAKKGVKGSFIYGILFVTLVSWVRGTRVTYFPNTPIGDTNYSYFKRIIHFHPIQSTMGALSFNDFNRSEVWVALATLLYVDMLDTTGTMYSMAEIAGFVDEHGGFEGDYVAFLVDSASSILGSALGTSTMATYVESSAGIKEGGRTGLTALTVGLCFFGSMFFTPLLTSVPPWAVGPSMVMIGAMMMRTALDINWGDAGEGVPAFVTMALMPLTYSIAYGIIGGLMVYVALRVPDWVVEAVRWVVKARRSAGGAWNQVAEAGGSGGGGDCRSPEGV